MQVTSDEMENQGKLHMHKQLKEFKQDDLQFNNNNNSGNYCEDVLEEVYSKSPRVYGDEKF